MSKNVFFIGIILAASGLLSPPIALAAGLVFGFSFAHPFHIESKKLSKILLQASVVGLGFGMDLQQVIQRRAARDLSILRPASASPCYWDGRWQAAECQAAHFVPDFYGHRNMRWKRDSSSSADFRRQRGRDRGFHGSGVCVELGRVARISFDRDVRSN